MSAKVFNMTRFFVQGKLIVKRKTCKYSIKHQYL